MNNSEFIVSILVLALSGFAALSATIPNFNGG